MIAGGLKGHIGIEDMERRALAGGEGAYTDLVDEELPPLERVYARVRSNEEEVRGAKIVEWGWRDLQPDDAEPLAEILCLATNAVDLRLYVNEVGPTGGPAIAKVLDALPKLVQVDLQQWQVGPEGAKPIADAMLKHPRLKSLKMYYNKLGREGAEIIAAAAAKSKTLTNLDLGSNDIGADGALAVLSAVMANPSITRLSLKKNGFDYEHETKAALMRIAAGRTPPVKLLLEDPNQLPEEWIIPEKEPTPFVAAPQVAKTGDWAMAQGRKDYKDAPPNPPWNKDLIVHPH